MRALMLHWQRAQAAFSVLRCSDKNLRFRDFLTRLFVHAA